MSCLDLAGPHTTPTGTRGIVGAWMNAGCRAGVCLGAAFGAAIVVFGGFAPLVVIGAVAGAVVGGFAGVAVGTANGVVLGVLATTSVFGGSARHPTRTATAVAVITTAAGGLAVQLTLFGNPSGIAERVATVYVPVTMGVLAAAALSRRLPPGHPHNAGRHRE